MERSLLMIGCVAAASMLAVAFFAATRAAADSGPFEGDPTRGVPPIDADAPAHFETATFALG